MAGDGSVSRVIVLRVLEIHEIDLSSGKRDNPFPLTIAAKGTDPKETLQVHALPERLNRRMLQYLARRYDVPIHHFYNENIARSEKAKRDTSLRKRSPIRPVKGEKKK
jgi:hypothetical protein